MPSSGISHLRRLAVKTISWKEELFKYAINYLPLHYNKNKHWMQFEHVHGLCPVLLNETTGG